MSLLDLTELSSTASPSSTHTLVARALDPAGGSLPHVAAVCVHSQLVPAARAALASTSGVRLACVAGAFPLGKAPLAVRWEEVRQALDDGADEVDVVIDRGAALSGDWDSIEEYVTGCVAMASDRGALVKVILETGELGSAEVTWAAAQAALRSGAHFLKTSTGFAARGASLEAAALLLLAVRDFAGQSGTLRGVKVSGGVTTLEQASRYVALARALDHPVETATFRFGASSLLTDLTAAWGGAPRSGPGTGY